MGPILERKYFFDPAKIGTNITHDIMTIVSLKDHFTRQENRSLSQKQQNTRRNYVDYTSNRLFSDIVLLNGHQNP